MRLLFFLFIVIHLFIGYQVNAQEIDIQGHRGARGLMPENSIPGFLKALDYGVTTLELDLAITGDSLVVVSHEPYFSSDFCTDPHGNEIKKSDQKKLNIYQLPYEEIKKYDCGLKPHPNFPDQEKVALHKPLLQEVIKAVEKHIKSKTFYEVDYNIEIKSTPAGDDEYHPSPGRFSDLVYNLVDQYLPWDRVIIQSFDFRVLQYWHKNYPQVRLAALIDSPGSVENKLNKLGFEPAIYSPYYKFLNEDKVNYLHRRDIKVIPWTVNEPEEMKKLIGMGVDGIITDYPDLAARLGYTRKIKTNIK